MAGIDINRTTTGVELPPAVSAEIWSETIESSAVMAAARQITLPGTGVSVPMVTSDAQADWVDETEEKPVDRPEVGSKTITPYKLAVITPFSNEFRRDLPTLYRELVRRLPLALARKFDETVFGNSGAPGANFDQLGGAPTVTVDNTNSFQDFAGVVNTLAAAGAELNGWIVGPSLHGIMLTSTDMLGRQFFVTNPQSQSVGQVFGAPVYRTRGLMPSGAGATADKTGFAGDWQNSAVWGSVQGIQVRVSDQATINDGGTQINLWQRNMSAVLAEMEVGFRIRDISHFVSLNDGTAD